MFVFRKDRPAAIPILTDVFDAIQAWLVSASTVPRVHFYSAREEQEETAPTKTAPPKKGPPKKITNQAIMEQLASLGSQLQVLASQQEELRKGVVLPSATPAVVPSGLMPLTAKMPSLSGTLQVPAKPLSHVAKALGPPPKTKTPDVVAAAGGGSRADGGLGIQPDRQSYQSTKPGLNRPRCPPSRGGPHVRATVANRPLRDRFRCQGLVIDDFFSVTIESDGTLPEHSQAYQDYLVSQQVYHKHRLLGSPQKDILGLPSGKIIGAWVNAEETTRRRGLATVSSPPQKRLGLSHVSLEVASLSHTSDSLHLCLVGGWVSAMGYRRPMYSLFNRAYNLVDTMAFDPNHPKLVPLPRLVAQELVLASVLHPLMMSDVGAVYHDRIFATDASQHKGAICSMPVDPDTAEVLWKTSKSKGSYTRLQTPTEVFLKRLGLFEEHDFEGAVSSEPSPTRPLAYRFDFIEVYAGAAKVTSFVAGLGIATGPPIELSFSEEYDLRYCHVLAWLTYLVTERLVLAILLEPPCTTYSIIRRPALRSRSVPFGFDPSNPQTQVGNQLAGRACQIHYIAAINYVAAMLETPFSSLLKHLPFWKSAAALPCVRQARVDSCRFGSPHLKSFRMLCAHVVPDQINRRCQCNGPPAGSGQVHKRVSYLY